MFGTKKENNNTQGSPSSAHNSLVLGTVITGDITSKTDIRIDGKLEGNLFSEAKVVIGKNAFIQGDIKCQSILIEGKIEGNINAKERLHIQSSGTVTGDLITNKLIIEDGAVFNGASVMGKASFKENNHGEKENSGRRSNSKVQKAS